MSVLEMKNIRYSYDNKRNVLNGINMTLEEEKMYAILGQSMLQELRLSRSSQGLDMTVCHTPCLGLASFPFKEG